jgi:WD40 repeat protein
MAETRGLVAIGLGDGDIELRASADNFGAKVFRWNGHREVVSCLAFVDGADLVSGSWDGTANRWDPGTGVGRWRKELGAGRVFSVSECSGGQVGVGGEDGTVRVLDGATGEEMVVCRGHTGWVGAAVSLGPMMASGSVDMSIRVWAGDGTLVRSVDVSEWIMALSLSPCGKFVAAGCGHGLVNVARMKRVWDVEVNGAFWW